MKQRMIEKQDITAYSIYSKELKRRNKINPLSDIYPPLPSKKYEIIYAYPPWDYGGKMQFDNSIIKANNKGFERDIFLSAANFMWLSLT